MEQERAGHPGPERLAHLRTALGSLREFTDPYRDDPHDDPHDDPDDDPDPVPQEDADHDPDPS